MLHRVLVVEDDPSTAKILRLSLEPEGYKVLHTDNGLVALDIAQREHPGLVILDRKLPGLEGFEVCRRLRALSDVPILMLTAAGDEVDKIVGLSLGADDYVTKPFSPREVVARVHAIFRRTHHLPREMILCYRDLQVDLERHRVTVAGEEVQLTASEFVLLQTLLEAPTRVFSRSELLNRIYPHSDVAVGDRGIDVHMANLRKKLGEKPRNFRYITAVRGVGYKLI